MWFLKSGHRHIKAETLNEYLDGRLGGSDLAKIEGRWPACDSCHDELEELRATIAVVRQMPMEQPRRSFVMDAPSLPPAPARQPFYLRAPNWAYAGAASIAVVVLAALVSVDATGGLSPAADSHEVFVATAPQNRATAPQAGATALTDLASQATEGDSTEAAEFTVRQAAKKGRGLSRVHRHHGGAAFRLHRCGRNRATFCGSSERGRTATGASSGANPHR